MRSSRLLVAALLLCASSPAFAEVTFNKDVAPIVFARCASCHRPGAIAPFSLLTYREVRQQLTQIVNVTARRVMPPWKPTPGMNDFLDDRSLTDAQIQLIKAWADAGAPEGNARDLPAAPRFVDGWQLGPPDAVATMPAPFTVRADGPDVFRTFVLPIATDRVRYVRAIEFKPGNARVVHHANMGVDRTRSSRRLDEADAEPGYAGGMVPDAGYPPGYMLGWTPGQQARPSPDGMPWRLEPNSDMVVQLHMQPTGKPETLQVSVAFYFTDTPPAATPVGIRLGSQTIDIPAGDAHHQVSDRFTLPVDVDLLALQPHAHNLGREVRGLATLPDGTTRPLIEIADWDFRWQDVYRYRTPLRLPKGTVVSMTMTYDNSAANPRNSFQPPRRVVWGQNTADEMGDLWLQVVPVEKRDLATLVSEVRRKSAADDLAAYSKILADDPTNPLRHDQVGTLNLQSGFPAEAAEHFHESLRLNPDSAPTHYNLGLALVMMRRLEEATAEFERAIQIDSAHAEAHNNLGVMRQRAGRWSEALAEFRRAAALSPENTEALNNLGRLLVADRQYAEAAATLQRALAVNPDYVSGLAALALVRASGDAAQRNGEEAVRLATRAVVLTGRRDPLALDALAAALAEQGRFAEAASAEEEAIATLQTAGLAELAVEMQRRAGLYRSNQPYRLP
jgi:tetratricopeptide (TPR) repeat protein